MPYSKETWERARKEIVTGNVRQALERHSLEHHVIDLIIELASDALDRRLRERR